VLAEEEAFLLRRAITTIMEGGSLRDGCAIVRPLWPKVRPNSLRRTLLAPRIAGLRRLGGEPWKVGGDVPVIAVARRRTPL
jgi:hypothetical protein